MSSGKLYIVHQCMHNYVLLLDRLDGLAITGLQIGGAPSRDTVNRGFQGKPTGGKDGAR